MYAIIKTGGKQKRVKVGTVLDVELLPESVGSAVKFQDVLLVNDGQHIHVGSPQVAGYVVEAELIAESKGPKITSVKYKPSHTSCRIFGHRQHYSRVKITGIKKGG